MQRARTIGELRASGYRIRSVREEMRANQQRMARIENELHAARGSLGIGINGLGLGVIYLLVQIGWDEQDLSRGLVVNAVLIGVVSGVLLELANFLFLSKRKLINQLQGELQLMRDETKELQRKIREGSSRR